MSNVGVHYGGRDFSVGGRSLAEVEQVIDAILASGTPGWLDANFGEGRPTTARLLVAPGIPIVLIGHRPEEESPEEV